MGIKIEWDSSRQEFYVRTGKGHRQARKTSKEMIKYIQSITDSKFTWSWAAKRQVSKEK